VESQLNIQLPFPELLPESSWRPPDSFPDISGAKWISIDIESHDPHLKERGPGFIRGDAFVCGVAVHTDGFVGYFPTRHATGSNLAPNVVFEWLRDQAKNFKGELYGANLIYDLQGLFFEGVKFRDEVKYLDIQICEPLLDENAFSYSLETLSQKYLNLGKEEALLQEVAGLHTKGFKDRRAKRPIRLDPKGDLWMLSPEYVGAYAEADTLLPKKIYDKQKEQIDKEDLNKVLELESSLIPLLLKMRILGVRVDLEAAEKLSKTMTVEINKYSLEIKKLAGFDVNVDSGQDLTKAYNTIHFNFPEFQIDRNLKHTALGNPSFTADWYAAQKDPLSLHIARKKKLQTLRDNFVLGDICKEQVNGRLHCQFHQLRQDNQGTRSGRFSSTHINLQQIPNRDSETLWPPGTPAWSKEVRKLFVPDEKRSWLRSDYAQQELRLLVHFAGLMHLEGSDVTVEAFGKNPKIDFHRFTTDLVNQKSGKNFKRGQIKSVSLGILYGIGVQKLCKMLNLSIQEGKEILDAYHEALPFVKRFSTKCSSVAQDRGYVKSILGMRRRFDLFEPVPESKEEREFKIPGKPFKQAQEAWPNRRLQRVGVHKGANSIIQGSAAGQNKSAMRVLYYEYGIVPHLTLHDELGVSVCDMEEARLIKRVMEEAIPLIIPVVADAAIGDSWGNAKEEVT